MNTLRRLQRDIDLCIRAIGAQKRELRYVEGWIEGKRIVLSALSERVRALRCALARESKALRARKGKGWTTPAERALMRRLRAEGKSLREISRRVGRPTTSISRLIAEKGHGQLSHQAIERMRAERKRGDLLRDIAERHGVSLGRVQYYTAGLIPPSTHHHLRKPPETVREIVHRLGSGEPVARIAAEVGCSQTTVRQIMNRYRAAAGDPQSDLFGADPFTSTRH